MIDEDGKKLTSHSLNPVYFIVCDDEVELLDGSLKDIAPTVLSIMGLEIPDVMSGWDLREVIL